MRQVLRAGALGRPRGMQWGGRRERGSGWGTHVNPRLIHVNVWQKPLQYCKVISLQLIKINEKIYIYINSLKAQSFHTPQVNFSLTLHVEGKCSASGSHSRTHGDGHFPTWTPGRERGGKDICPLFLCPEQMPATAAQSSLAAASQISTSAHKGAGKCALHR